MKTIQVKNVILGEGIPKIIIPIMASTAQDAAARCIAARDAGAQMIELRADACPGALASVLPACREAAPELPILFTLRTASEGGLYNEDIPMGDDSGIERTDMKDGYSQILISAIDSGCVDMVDIELARPNTPQLLARSHTKGIPAVLSYHCFTGTPSREVLKERLVQMEKLGGDLAKIACMPASQADVSSLLSLSAWAKEHLEIPFLIIAMGERGAVSRISGEVYGSAMSFACLPGEASAPGQLEAGELKDVLNKRHALAPSCLVFLTGFMGSGKTSAAKALAGTTGLPLIEMDERIEEETGKSIPELFEELGEQGFRDLETNLIAGFWNLGGAIVSCGGGAVLREENRDFMRALGKVVLLFASPETTLRRLTGESEGRPNIRNRMTLEGVTELMEQRREAYEAAADLKICTDELSVRQISERICRKLQLPLA